MIISGLVSVTFRKLSTDEIIHLVKKSGLKAIEWGGDIHVPHGNISLAKETAKKTIEAGLTVASYGSYYRVGAPYGINNNPDFNEVLDTAVNLHAPVIRVWAGRKGSRDITPPEYENLLEDAKKIAEQAADAGIDIAFEYHGNTVTDSNSSAIRLIKDINRDNVFLYWQPELGLDFSERKKGLENIVNNAILKNIHVFYWRISDNKIISFPLSEGKNEWIEYFKIIANTNLTHYAMLEFVRNDDTAQFLEDANTLSQILQMV